MSPVCMMNGWMLILTPKNNVGKRTTITNQHHAFSCPKKLFWAI